jgi:hypothetical protein
MIRLLLAGIWLVLGGYLIIWHWLHPAIRTLRIWGSDVSVGWVALAMALYNFGRWWSDRARARRRGIAEEMRRLENRRKVEPPQSIDPTFQFTEDTKPPN